VSSGLSIPALPQLPLGGAPVLSSKDETGGSPDDLTKFYTALYHVFENPNVASDVNGQYMGFDRSVHTADGWTVYQNYSGWDIIRSWTHLISAVAPEAPDIIRSMVQDGAEGGLLPFWTHQNVETRVMVGDPGTVNVANAYAMGVRGFDTQKALELMVKSASNPNDTQRYGLTDWVDRHFMDNAATMQEYAMADFAIAQFAEGLGETATHDEYLARSIQWRESWNAEDGFIEPSRRLPGRPRRSSDASSTRSSPSTRAVCRAMTIWAPPRRGWSGRTSACIR
jgi:putative alpha-1,2-mannosidase